MHEYIQSPQYYSFAEIAWTVYDKYFVSNNPIFCIKGKKKYVFQVFVENKNKNPELWY